MLCSSYIFALSFLAVQAIVATQEVCDADDPVCSASGLSLLQKKASKFSGDVPTKSTMEQTFNEEVDGPSDGEMSHEVASIETKGNSEDEPKFVVELSKKDAWCRMKTSERLYFQGAALASPEACATAAAASGTCSDTIFGKFQNNPDQKYPYCCCVSKGHTCNEAKSSSGSEVYTWRTRTWCDTLASCGGNKYWLVYLSRPTVAAYCKPSWYNKHCLPEGGVSAIAKFAQGVCWVCRTAFAQGCPYWKEDQQTCASAVCPSIFNAAGKTENACTWHNAGCVYDGATSTCKAP